MTFKNKVVWVTGASSGIGRELCVELEKAGALLILSGRNLPALQELMLTFSDSRKHNILVFDLAESGGFDAVASKAWEFNQKVDVLVNNGGISQRSLALETSQEVDRQIMEVDYFGTIALTKALLPRMVERKQGRVINIASIAGKVGSPLRSAYSGAKHALIGFMDCLRAEVADQGIEVINVCPGFVNTNISKNALTGDMSTYQQVDVEIANGMPVGRFVDKLLQQLKKNKSEIILAEGKVRLGYQLRRMLPNLFHRILPRIYRRTL